jgi:BirA family transcriptional regulator, biotin operon repressor / biotin---[acetyl-CoA-carboxylase] ligase
VTGPGAAPPDGPAGAPPADLAPARVLPLLTTARFGRAYEPHGLAGSTNDLVAARARAGAPEGLLVVADAQTAGRGRLGRSWQSPAGQNLYLSLLLRPEIPAAELPPLTLVAGAAVAGVLVGMGVSPRLKWPNDVLVQDGAGGQPRKLCGILTEMATEGQRVRALVLGIGLDVNQRAFPPELAGRASSLALITGADHDRGALLAGIMNALEPAYDRALREGAADSLRTWRAFADLPRACRVERAGGTEALAGTAFDIDDAGALLLRDHQGRVHRVLSGELVATV